MKVFLSLLSCMGPLTEGHQACGCFILANWGLHGWYNCRVKCSRVTVSEISLLEPLCVPSKKRTFSERSTNTHWLKQSPPPSPTSAQSSKLSSRDQSLKTYWEYRTHLFTYTISSREGGIPILQTGLKVSPWLFVVAQLLSRVWLFCDPMDCNPRGSSVHEILQARILAWVAICFSRGSSQPRDQTLISCISGIFITSEPPGKPAFK